jgi:uncharacterized protein (TIGR03083 family)
MELKEYRDHVAADGTRLVEAARSAPEAQIPSCPDWDMRQLISHVSAVHAWVAMILAEQIQEAVWPRRISEFPSEFDEAAREYDDSLRLLLEQLSKVDPDALVWNWSDRKPAPASFWFRRMAHETVIHRIDAEEAAGAVTVIDPDLATDGVDEYLRVGCEPPDGLTSRLSFQTTDTGASWRVALGSDQLAFDPPGDPQGTVQAPANDLYLWLVHREAAMAGPVELSGDREAIAQWSAIRFE